MENIRTFEEFNPFRRKELTPEEEYKKQEKEAIKNRDKMFGKEKIKKDLPYQIKERINLR